MVDDPSVPQARRGTAGQRARPVSQRRLAGLSLRTLAKHAGVNPGMFHHHFKSQGNFLRALLHGLYEEMLSDLQMQAAHSDTTLDQLRAALFSIARFARWCVIVQLWMDAISGQKVALDVMQDNALRHLGPAVAAPELLRQMKLVAQGFISPSRLNDQRSAAHR